MKTVIKRDGTSRQSFSIAKIEASIKAASRDSNVWTTSTRAPLDDRQIAKIAARVEEILPDEVNVEEIQDAIEVALMRAHRHDVAKSFILYRENRAEKRRERLHPDPGAMQEYIHASKYARYLPEIQRREVYDETVARVEMMHLKRFPHLRAQINWAFDLVRERKVLPSMRTMQFGGAAIEACHNRGYNCTATLVDRPRVFAEAMFLLLSGCGTGYSVQYEHVEKLPALAYVKQTDVRHHIVGDTIEGWADAVDALVQGYIQGYNIEFAFHQIRDAGSPLVTSGGRAPGHLRLKQTLQRVREVLHGAQGRQLRPVECHRIMCHIADAVLSGGIRRSAMICLFSYEDSEMMNLKVDASWFDKEPWLANANNSVVLVRGEATKKQFERILKATRAYGEPGFLFVSKPDHVTNPCSEIGLNPVLAEEWVAMGDTYSSTQTGWAMCNLCEINAAKLTSLDDYLEAAKAATFIGTLQASYTDFPYLGTVTEKIVRRDALLGVGMTGIQDAPHIARNPTYQRQVAEACVAWNREFAALIGINPAARVTTVKPSGTTSLALGNVGSGIHAHHARRYIRRVTADALEVVFQAFKAANPHMCVQKPDGKWVIEFPVEAPDGAAVKEDFSAIEFLGMVRSTQQNWVVPGTARDDAGLRHNVSNTVTVKPDEWDAVCDYLWKYRNEFTGVSLLPSMGDTLYAFAPFEAVKTDAQERRWNDLVADYKPVDYLAMFEAEDGTALTAEAACAGGACEIPT